MNAGWFPLPLRGEIQGCGRRFVLTEPFAYVDGDRRIDVPAGFVSDWNSVPRGLWNYFPPWEFPEAAVIHDWLYQTNGVTRKDADQIHRRILELTGCRWGKRHAAYLALRLFGWRPWNRYRAR